MKAIKVLHLIPFIVLICMPPVFAQKSDTLELRFDERGQLSFGRYVANEKSNRKLSASIPFLKGALKAKPDDDFRLIKTEQDELGITHQRYQQYYKGVKVEGAIFVLHGKNDAIEIMNGNFAPLNIASTSPARNESQSLNSALKFVNASKCNQSCQYCP